MANLYSELKFIFEEAAQVLTNKERVYGASWKQRGGIGAFMMLARKWDRIELASKNNGWNIFHAIEKDPELMDDIRDLRNYLTLVEHEVHGRRKINGTGNTATDSPKPAGAAAEELAVDNTCDAQDVRAR